MKVVFEKDEKFSLEALADKMGVPADFVDEFDDSVKDVEDVEIEFKE